MFENRVQEYYAAPILTPAGAGVQTAFVPCPVPLFATFNYAQQAFVAEVYRRAQELAAAQLKKPTPRPIPEFSLN